MFVCMYGKVLYRVSYIFVETFWESMLRCVFRGCDGCVICEMWISHVILDTFAVLWIKSRTCRCMGWILKLQFFVYWGIWKWGSWLGLFCVLCMKWWYIYVCILMTIGTKILNDDGDCSYWIQLPCSCTG